MVRTADAGILLQAGLLAGRLFLAVRGMQHAGPIRCVLQMNYRSEKVAGATGFDLPSRDGPRIGEGRLPR